MIKQIKLLRFSEELELNCIQWELICLWKVVYTWLKNKNNIKKTYGENEVNDNLSFFLHCIKQRVSFTKHAYALICVWNVSTNDFKNKPRFTKNFILKCILHIRKIIGTTETTRTQKALTLHGLIIMLRYYISSKYDYDYIKACLLNNCVI